MPSQHEMAARVRASAGGVFAGLEGDAVFVSASPFLARSAASASPVSSCSFRNLASVFLMSSVSTSVL